MDNGHLVLVMDLSLFFSIFKCLHWFIVYVITHSHAEAIHTPVCSLTLSACFLFFSSLVPFH